MQDKGYTTTLIQTKLNRPPLPVVLVQRLRLTEWLKRHREHPLTLVSAAAGYGKSTVISSWLEEVDWLSVEWIL